MRIKKFNENWVDVDPKEIAVENTLWNEVINFIQSSKSDINN